ncbi:MAG: iron chelate uptake ABC transporter family permease subunit, partial [Gammaproteobacteria bacterium]|nr:iron chelate uptake ABC transporter family permease subunit [Gammaproteobacteria bacterium]
MKCSSGILYSISALLLIALGLLHVLWGPTELFNVQDVLAFLSPGKASGEDQAWLVFKELRLPRTLLAALVGAALGVSGALLQSFFKNP